MSTATAPDPQWVDARNAARMLGVPGARNIRRLAERGMISTRDLPGVRARYSRSDVERLARESVAPAALPEASRAPGPANLPGQS